MSTLAQIADKNPNCGGMNANTGDLGCQTEFGTPLHAIAIRKGFIIPKDTVFDKVYIDTQTQLGTFIPIIEADSFEELSSEDTFSTNSRGVDRLSTPGLPKYKLTYQSGHEFYKQIAKLTSFKSLDFIFGDGEGNWRIAVNSDGDFTGYSCGQVTAMMTKTKVQGGDPESKSITVQMLDREQWDKNYAILNRQTLTFSPTDIGGINGVDITVGPIAASATSVTIKVVLSADRMTPVEGLELVDFLITVNGVPSIATVLTENPDGEYVIAIDSPAAGTKIVVSTYDLATKTLAILVDGTLYRGISAPVTVSI
jgi:hypothetical protein